MTGIILILQHKNLMQRQSLSENYTDDPVTLYQNVKITQMIQWLCIKMFYGYLHMNVINRFCVENVFGHLSESCPTVLGQILLKRLGSAVQNEWDILTQFGLCGLNGAIPFWSFPSNKLTFHHQFQLQDHPKISHCTGIGQELLHFQPFEYNGGPACCFGRKVLLSSCLVCVCVFVTGFCSQESIGLICVCVCRVLIMLAVCFF